jgi:hypothetical protein
MIVLVFDVGQTSLTIPQNANFIPYFWKRPMHTLIKVTIFLFRTVYIINGHCHDLRNT